MWTFSRNLLLVSMASLMLCGCGSKQAPGGSVAGSSGSRPKKPADPAQVAMMRNMVGAVPANAAVEVPVQVRFQLRERPQVGQPVDVQLVIIPADDSVDQLVGHVQADDGLDLVSGDQIPASERPAADVPITHSIKVLPKRDGIFTFSAVLTVDSGGQTLTQTYSMPVIAGSGLTTLPPAAPAKSGKPAPPASGATTAATH